MDDEKSVADRGAKPGKPPLSRWAVASIVGGLATVCLAPICAGDRNPAPQVLAMLVAVVSGVTALFSIHFSRGFRRGQFLAMVGVFLSLVAFSATPRFHMVRKSSVAGTMRNDARWIASAAQQYLIEYGAESVAFVYDPATGEVGEPLRPFVARIAKGYSPVPERLTRTGTFQIGRAEVGVLTFDATGRPVVAVPPGK